MHSRVLSSATLQSLNTDNNFGHDVSTLSIFSEAIQKKNGKKAPFVLPCLDTKNLGNLADFTRKLRTAAGYYYVPILTQTKQVVALLIDVRFKNGDEADILFFDPLGKAPAEEVMPVIWAIKAQFVQGKARIDNKRAYQKNAREAAYSGDWILWFLNKVTELQTKRLDQIFGKIVAQTSTVPASGASLRRALLTSFLGYVTVEKPSAPSKEASLPSDSEEEGDETTAEREAKKVEVEGEEDGEEEEDDEEKEKEKEKEKEQKLTPLPSPSSLTTLPSIRVRSTSFLQPSAPLSTRKEAWFKAPPVKLGTTQSTYTHYAPSTASDREALLNQGTHSTLPLSNPAAGTVRVGHHVLPSAAATNEYKLAAFEVVDYVEQANTVDSKLILQPSVLKSITEEKTAFPYLGNREKGALLIMVDTQLAGCVSALEAKSTQLVVTINDKLPTLLKEAYVFYCQAMGYKLKDSTGQFLVMSSPPSSVLTADQGKRKALDHFRAQFKGMLKRPSSTPLHSSA